MIRRKKVFSQYLIIPPHNTLIQSFGSCLASCYLVKILTGAWHMTLIQKHVLFCSPSWQSYCFTVRKLGKSTVSDDKHIKSERNLMSSIFVNTAMTWFVVHHFSSSHSLQLHKNNCRCCLYYIWWVELFSNECRTPSAARFVFTSTVYKYSILVNMLKSKCHCTARHTSHRWVNSNWIKI